MNEFNNNFQTEYQPEPQPSPDLKTAKKAYSTIGLSLCAIIVIVFGVQFIIGIVIGLLGEAGTNFLSSSWGMWIISFVPLYGFAIPVGMLCMKKLPTLPLEQHKMSAKSFWMALPITVCLMSVGNYIGTFLSAILSSGTAENALNDFAMDTNPLKIVVMVILAPLLEEYVFRKQIIDRTYMYGEKTAIIFSALLFGLFHMNLFQFFYAFFVGIVFGYVYLRTGKLRYSVILHSIVNFFGSVVAPFILSKLDFEALNKIASLDPTEMSDEILNTFITLLPGLLLLFGYSLLWGALGLAGFIILIVKRKDAVLNKAPLELPKDTVANTVYMNIGIVLFIVLSVTLSLVNLFAV